MSLSLTPRRGVYYLPNDENLVEFFFDETVQNALAETKSDKKCSLQYFCVRWGLVTGPAGHADITPPSCGAATVGGTLGAPLWLMEVWLDSKG